MNPLDTIDKIVHCKFLANNLSPEEILPLFSPQILLISDPNLNGEEFPALEQLTRNSLAQDQIYILFNSFAIYIYVGRQADPFFFNEIFKVPDYNQIDKSMSEEEIFENAESSTYLNSLYNIINQIRYTRVPFVEIKILYSGERDDE